MHMIIENIKKITTSKNVRVSADITFNNEHTKNIYFLINKQYESFLMNDASSFLATVLLPCMKKREDIYIKGTVSKTFLSHTKRIMRLMTRWNPSLYPIHIYSETTEDTIPTARYNGSFFSGGVDSFYTFTKYKKRSKNSITYFLLINGFDIELANKTLWNKTVRNVKKISQAEHVLLITIETNLRYIIEPVLEWDWSHGGALGAVALLLRNKFKTIYIPSNVQKNDLFPYGTHPQLDHLWGTKQLHIIHDGVEATRIEKIKLIAVSSTALRYLRVCSQNTRGTYNCGQCFKCLRTMIELKITGLLSQSKTFPHTINLKLVRKMYFPKKHRYSLIAKHYIAELGKQKGNSTLIEALQQSLVDSEKMSPFQKICAYIAYLDKTYNKRRIYMSLFSLTPNQDRNSMYKLLLSVGVIR